MGGLFREAEVGILFGKVEVVEVLFGEVQLGRSQGE